MIKMIQEWFTDRFSDPQIVILWFFLISGFLVIFFMGEMLQPVFAGLIIAYLLEGIVKSLEAVRLPRTISVFLTFFFFVVCVILLVIWLLPLLSKQIGQFIHDLPSMIASTRNHLIQLPERYPQFITEEQINNLIFFLKSEITRLGQNILAFSIASVRNLITVLVYLVLVPFLILFFLKDKAMIVAWIKGFLPKNRDLATDVWDEVNKQIGNYVRGKIFEILIVWGVSYIVFSFLELRYAMLLSMFNGLALLIPYVGSTVIFFPVFFVAYFEWGIAKDFFYVILAYLIIHLVDGHILVPLLFSEVVNLHPVAIIVAILVFGGLWGIWGLFFAIPLATLVHAVLKAWFIKREYVNKQVTHNPSPNQ
jgi:putative permease